MNLTSLMAWYEVCKWECITKPRMNRGARRLGFRAPDFGGTLQDKHDEWVQQIWMNRKSKATHKIIELCDHAHGVDEDGYCLICTGETDAVWQIDNE